MSRRSWWFVPLVVSQLVLACSSTSNGQSTTTATTVPATAEPTTTSSAAPTVAPSTTTTSSTIPATTTSTTLAPSLVTETRVIGKSVLGRDITAYRMGDPTGRPVLLIGVIHGNEEKGVGITQLIRTMPPPPAIDLWIIDSINPDGQAADTRQNANGVDLNRNVSWNWNYIPKSADNGQNSGGARPVTPDTFASIVGLSTASTPCTAGCTGTATQYVNHAVKGGTAFIVELPGNNEVTPEMIALHAKAALHVIPL